MSDFWSNLAANLVGTFVGAGLALISSHIATRNAARRAEAKRAQGIVDHISRARTFARTDYERSGPLSQAELDDLNRSTASILTIREHISRTLVEMRPVNPMIPILEDMFGACSLYLRSIEDDPSCYVRAIIDLRDALWQLETQIPQVNKSIVLWRPGQRAFPLETS